jgi:hypothetical protein
MNDIDSLKLTDSQLNKLAKIAKNENISLNDAIKIYVSIKVNYRQFLDIANLKSAWFETMSQANSFKQTMESEGYIVFEPHYAIMMRDLLG